MAKVFDFYYFRGEELSKLTLEADEMDPLFVDNVETPLTTSLLSATYNDDYHWYCNWYKPSNGDDEYYFAPIPAVHSYENPYFIGWRVPGGRGQLSVAFENKILEYVQTMRDPAINKKNIYKLTSASDRSKMFYEDGTFDENPPSNPYTGKELTYINPQGEQIKLNLALYVKDEIEQGVTVPYAYTSGLYNVDPPAIIGPRQQRKPYNVNQPPAIGLWYTNVHCNREGDMPTMSPWRSGGDGEYYDTDIEVLIVVAINGSDYAITIIPTTALNGVTASEPTTDSPEGTNVTPTGWTGNWDFSSDHDQPKATTGYGWANIWEHGLTLYSLTSNEVGTFLNDMWNFSIIKAIKIKWGELTKGDNFDWIRGIISLHILPWDVGKSTDERNITIFGQKIGDAKGHLISKDHNFQHIITITSNDLEVPYTIDDNVFLDYDYCKSYLSLPFIGQVPVDVKKYRGGHIKVEYKIDILTGNCIARVYAASKKLPGKFADESGKQILIYQGTGNCAIHIPYCGNTEGGFKQLGAIAGVAMTAVGIATGTAPVTAAGAMGATSQLTKPPENTETHSYIATEGGGLMYPDVKLVIEGPFPQIPERQRLDYGYAAFQTATVGDFYDYPGRNFKESPREFLQGKIHCNIPNATDAEKQAIEAWFEKGVLV